MWIFEAKDRELRTREIKLSHADHVDTISYLGEGVEPRGGAGYCKEC